MSNIKYKNFDLLIHKNGGGTYQVRVESPVGERSEKFEETELAIERLNNNAGQIENEHERRRFFVIEENLEKTDNIVLKPIISKPLTRAQAKNAGKVLFETVFKDSISAALESSTFKTREARENLRIRFKLTSVPELAGLPWEYIFDETKNHFIAQGQEVSIARYLDTQDQINDLLVNPPLRILVIISNPSEQTNIGKLDVEKEWKDIKDTFKEFESKNLVEIERLEIASLEKLEDKLAFQPDDKPFHILHYIGHGVFDKKVNEGKLIFEDNGYAHPIAGENLSTILRNHGHFRMVVLNACEGASISKSDSYAGVAQEILRKANIPAIVAMQYEITDKAALKFSERFYKMIVNGKPIDFAVASARMAILGMENDTEWAVPVLYMRSDSGDIFNPIQIDDHQPAPLPIITDNNEHYEGVVKALFEGKLVPFIGLDINLLEREEKENWTPDEPFLPSSRELARYLAQEFNYIANDVPNLTSISQYIAVKEGELRLYECLKDIFYSDYDPTSLHKFLAKIPKYLEEIDLPRSGDVVKQRFIIITNNYDNLLEKAFDELNYPYHKLTYQKNNDRIGRFYHSKWVNNRPIFNPYPIKDINDNSKFDDKSPIILKLPGTVDEHVQKFAITEDDYSDYLTLKDLSQLLPVQVKSKLINSHQLFLGSSLRNWHLRALLYRVWDNRRSPGYKSWAVHPSLMEVDNGFWEKANVEVIKERFEIYIRDLEKHLIN